jgi:hypothetical protein
VSEKMDDNQIWKYGFVGFIACSMTVTYWVFKISKAKKLNTKILMRAGILSLLYSPCILVGHGGAIIAPAGVVLLLFMNGILREVPYMVGTLISMILTFVLCMLYFYSKTGPSDYR